MRSYFEELNEDQKEKVQVTLDVLKLAETYVQEKVVGETSLDDCIHIAVATINKVDLLVSWNFKHIVNVYRILGYNAVNLKLGIFIHQKK